MHQNNMSVTSSVPKTWRIAEAVLRAVLAFAFFAAGGAKLFGAPGMVHIFQAIGVGQWFRFLTAILEIGGDVLILLPRTSFYGAALLVCIMVGALVTHFFLIGGNPAPATILLVLTLIVLWRKGHDFSPGTSSRRGQL